jgi:hypothetical protein
VGKVYPECLDALTNLLDGGYTVLKIEHQEQLTFEQFLNGLLLYSWFVVEVEGAKRLYNIKEKTSQGGYKLLCYSNLWGFQDCELPSKSDVAAWANTAEKFYKVDFLNITVKQVGPTLCK